MTQGIYGNSEATSVSATSLGPTMSLQLMFAKLQLELAQTSKGQAVDRMNAISRSQDEQKQISALLNAARSAKSSAPTETEAAQYVSLSAEKATVDGFLREARGSQLRAGSISLTQRAQNKKESGEKESTMMSVEMENYFKEHNLRYADDGVSRRQNMVEWQIAINSLNGRAKDLQTQMDALPKGGEIPNDMKTYMDEKGLKYPGGVMTRDKWDAVIADLEGRMEQLGTDTQQQMVYIQDYMGQYNSYLQGANTQIANSNQTLSSLARGQ